MSSKRLGGPQDGLQRWQKLKHTLILLPKGGKRVPTSSSSLQPSMSLFTSSPFLETILSRTTSSTSLLHTRVAQYKYNMK
jgi:hypothetical protein